MNSQRVKVVLNPDRDEDRRILVFLQSADEPMSKVFKAAMLQYVESSIGGVNHEKLLRDIREIVHEELQQIQIREKESYSQPVSKVTDEEEISPLDFLDQLEAMATI